ncbi:MAG: DegT/DnrJ/EryC1/StrS family aminotransferase [Eubacterium sp.]|jgi:dTDP-4-amino-4,6-dideoxygalactose transaminase|nr:DegT/DnrJ/EryC1/StrS family aminotransferase [Eubacterium sp.]
MEVKILDLSRQYELIQEKVEKAVCEQMRSGMYIGGKAVADFEKKFAEYIGVKHAISVNSGTDALVIALKALGIKEGDEVITTPFTFFATAETIAMVGAVPVFVDVEEDSYNIDPEKIEEKITEKTKAILPVHIFGQPANMERILDIANKHELVVIEDACQAVGAAIAGKKAGSIGNAGCFSFFPTKNLGAFGDGGMITTNDDTTAIICRAFKEHGMAQNGAKARYILQGVEDDLANTVSTDGLYNPYKYYNYLIAYNSRLDAIQARVLDIKLDFLDDFNGKRAEIAKFYEKELGSCSEVITPQIKDKVTAVWHQYAFRCKKKDEMGNFLASKGVGSAAFYPVPLHLQKAFEYLGYQEGDLPVAEMLTKQTVCLPIFPELKEEELQYIVVCIKEFFEK